MRGCTGVGKVAPEMVRAKPVKNITSTEQLGETLLRTAGAKVKGEALDVAKGVGRNGGSELWRRTPVRTTGYDRAKGGVSERRHLRKRAADEGGTARRPQVV